MLNGDFKSNRKNLLILGLIISITGIISIQWYKMYISEPKIEIINQFWSKYSKIYENSLNATLEIYCNDDAKIMIIKHTNEETNKLIKELKYN